MIHRHILHLLTATLLAAFVLGIGSARAQLARERPDLLSASAYPSVREAKPGDVFALRIRFRVKQGAWLYGPNPGGKLIPAQPAVLTPPEASPFAFRKPKWPPTSVHVTDLGGQTDRHNVYTGEQTIEVPVTVRPDAPKGEWAGSVTLSGQVCTPGTCTPVVARAPFSLKIGERTQPTAPGAGFDVTRDAGKMAPRMHWLLALLAALLGGVILNFMPCVLPVVPIKVYSFLEHASRDPRRALRLALAFALGMETVFLALGAVMASLRLLWGAQFQSTAFVTTLGAVVFALGLWLLGAFTLTVPQSVAGVRVSRTDYVGSFAVGALATVLATPCSGPFLGGALAWAAVQPAPLVLLTFAVIGIGMALPYVVLVAQPQLLRRLPHPGPWMETWKQAMALLMFGVTIYFVHILPAEKHVPFLILCLALGVGAWVLNRWGQPHLSALSRRGAQALALAVVALGAWVAYRPAYIPTEARQVQASVGDLDWTPFSTATLNSWLADGETVILEWTADWCPNCKYVENTVYRNPEVVRRLKGKVRLLRADITRPFPEAERLLRKLGGQSIPFTAVFRAGDPAHPVILRDVYTARQLLEAVE